MRRETPLNLYTKTQISWYIIESMHGAYWIFNAYAEEEDVWYEEISPIYKSKVEDAMDSFKESLESYHNVSLGTQQAIKEIDAIISLIKNRIHTRPSYLREMLVGMHPQEFI